MKKTVLTTLFATAATAGALAQGTILFENSGSTGNITLDWPSGPYAAAGTYTVALLFAQGNTPNLPQSAFTQVALYGLATGGLTQSGFFFDTNVVVAGLGTNPGYVGVFEVQGWQGNATSYAAAMAAGGMIHYGQTAEFVNSMGGNSTPPSPLTGWDGNLILVVPEPGTIAIGGLGAASLLFFRRRK